MTGWLPDDATTWGDRPVARTVGAAESRARVHLRGVVTTMRICPATVGGGLLVGNSRGTVVEAKFDDGTGTVALRWLGRGEIPGVVPGVFVEVEGTLALVRHARVVLNPCTGSLTADSSTEPWTD